MYIHYCIWEEVITQRDTWEEAKKCIAIMEINLFSFFFFSFFWAAKYSVYQSKNCKGLLCKKQYHVTDGRSS